MSIEDQIAGFRTRAEDYASRLSALWRSLWRWKQGRWTTRAECAYWRPHAVV